MNGSHTPSDDICLAIITPSQDPISLFAMAIPMYLLYEISIILGRLLKR